MTRASIRPVPVRTESLALVSPTTSSARPQLSAFSGVVYLVATVALARRGSGARRVATVAITIELVGVLAVGTASVLAPDDFPRATVWSGYGSGYGFVPLVLPVVGLWWLRRTGRR